MWDLVLLPGVEAMSPALQGRFLSTGLPDDDVVVTVVQLLGCVRLLVSPWTAAYQAPLSFTVSQNLLKFMSIQWVMLSNHLILCCPLLLLLSLESMMPSNHLILCHPLLLLPSMFSSIRVFSKESALPIRWPNCWNFNFSISLFQLIFRIDFL